MLLPTRSWLCSLPASCDLHGSSQLLSISSLLSACTMMYKPSQRCFSHALLCMRRMLDMSAEAVSHLCRWSQHTMSVCTYIGRALQPHQHVCLDKHFVNDYESLVFICSFLGPMLFGCLMALLVWSIFQIFLPPGPVQNTIFSLLGSILFSAYIVYDTDNLIQRKLPLLLSCLTAWLLLLSLHAICMPAICTCWGETCLPVLQSSLRPMPKPLLSANKRFKCFSMPSCERCLVHLLNTA